MKTTTKNTGIKVNTGVKAGGLTNNHSRSGISVKTGLKGGYTYLKNHNARLARA
jgi:hypothetical protein